MRILTLVGKKPKLLEMAEQSSLIAWFHFQYPEMAKLLVHIPNGQNVGKIAGYKLKKMGLRAGFPDLFLYVPRGTFHGLAIEMKAVDGVVSKEQIEMLRLLSKEGYSTHVCYGAEQAMATISNYLLL